MMDETNRVPLSEIPALTQERAEAEMRTEIERMREEQRQAILRQNAAEMRKIVTGEDDPVDAERVAAATAAAQKRAEKDEMVRDHDAWERALRAKEMREDQRYALGIMRSQHADRARLVTRRR